MRPRKKFDIEKLVKRVFSSKLYKKTLKTMKRSLSHFTNFYNEYNEHKDSKIVFQNVHSPELKEYGEKKYLEKPPEFLFRIMPIEYLIKTIENDRIMYSRPRYFDDKNDVGLKKGKEFSEHYFSKEIVDTFKKELDKQNNVTNEDKKDVSLKIDGFQRFFSDLEYISNICCFTEDLRTTNPNDDDENSWDKNKSKKGAICIITDGYPNLHRTSYGKRPNCKTTTRTIAKLLFRKSTKNRIRGSFYDIIADYYVEFHHKKRKYSWEKEWRSIIIGKIDDGHDEVIYYKKNEYDRYYYHSGIVKYIPHIFVGSDVTDSEYESMLRISNEYNMGICVIDSNNILHPIKGRETECESCPLKEQLKCQTTASDDIIKNEMSRG